MFSCFLSQTRQLVVASWLSHQHLALMSSLPGSSENFYTHYDSIGFDWFGVRPVDLARGKIE